MTWPSFITEQKRSDVRTLHFKGLTTYFTGSSWRALHLSSIFCRQSTLNLNTDLPSIWCIRYQLPSTVGTHIQLSVCVCVWNSYKVGVNECPKTKWTCKTTVTWYWNLVTPKVNYCLRKLVFVSSYSTVGMPHHATKRSSSNGFSYLECRIGPLRTYPVLV